MAHPSLEPRLVAGRAELGKAAGGDDLYSSWLAAIRALAEAPGGALPSHAERPAFADLRLASALVAYGQIRHAYVLIAAQTYDEGGCVIPDGYVDPAPATYAALIRYAERGARFARDMNSNEVASYFERVAGRLSVLEAIARQQLSGAPLSEEARRWLSMVVEVEPPSSDQPGSYDGWYFDLFFRRADAFDSPAFVSDYYASVNTGKVSHLGAMLPRLALFVIDSDGPPRLVVGPVAHGFELIAPSRIGSAEQVGPRARRPWSTSYLAPSPWTPAFAARVIETHHEAGATRWVIAIDSRDREARVELLDHHRRPVVSGRVRPGQRRLELVDRTNRGVEAWRVAIGGASRFEALRYGSYNAHMEAGGAAPLAEPAPE
jgi:hypothetical protein